MIAGSGSDPEIPNAPPLRGLVHVHTWHSFDSILPPSAVSAFARWRDLDFVCVTDHNSIRGSVEVARQNRDRRLEVVIGAEYSTDRGDLIGLFLSEDVRSRTFDEAVDEIHGQGGLAVLPHPYRGRVVDSDRYGTVDLVEAFNGRTSEEGNRRAAEDIERLGLKPVAGADTHTMWELISGPTIVELPGQGGLRERLVEGRAEGNWTSGSRRTGRLVQRYSQLVKRVRRRVGRPGYR